MTSIDAQALADRYAAVWNDANPKTRRATIEALWSPEGEHYVGAREVRGYEQLQERVTGAYEKNVRDARHLFRAVKNAQQLRDVVTFNWEMIEPSNGEVLATGLEFLQLDAHGRIRVDHQFIVG
jgi:hypothetical protein